jgi:hypothetical protein
MHLLGGSKLLFGGPSAVLREALVDIEARVKLNELGLPPIIVSALQRARAAAE